MRKRIVVQGLGFVGAASVVAIAAAKKDDDFCYDVAGVDLPTDSGRARIDSLNRGVFPFESNDATLKAVTRELAAGGRIHAGHDPAVFEDADIVVVNLPLDIVSGTDGTTASFGGFVGGLRTLGARIKPSALVIIETTVPPGTCERIVKPVLAEEFARRGIDPDQIALAHSYERVMPGVDYYNSIRNFWRVYAGDTPAAAARCREFLSTIINHAEYPLCELRSTTESETAKILENAYRAVNIAFIREWSQFAERAGIDLFRIVDAIRVRPTHNNIRFPGLGVGGYCLTKDPLFVEVASRELWQLTDLRFPFCRLAVSTNATMPLDVVARLELEGVEVEGRNVAIMGISYRPDVADTRSSPTETLYEALSKKAARIVVCDPMVRFWPEKQVQVAPQIPSDFAPDIMILAVGHREYGEPWLPPAHDDRQLVVVDANRVLSAKGIAMARNAGARVIRIGTSAVAL